MLRLLAAGLTNAQAHVYAVYRKLAVATRAEATRAALAHGLA